jgi:DNA-binding transcriptional MerR regulator
MDMTVSKLAAEVGLNADTVRYYEKVGLLPAPARTPTGYRVYGEGAVDRLRFIRGAQRIGLRLREVKELLDIGDRGLCPCGHTESLLDRRVSEIDGEIASLRQTKRELLAFRDRFAAIDCPPGVQPWPCAAEFVAAADGKWRGVNQLGRHPVVSTDA